MPRRACCPEATFNPQKSPARASVILSARIGNSAVRRDFPALDCVEVIAAISPARRDQAGARWLRPAFVVERPALDHQWRAIPDKRQSETSKAFFEDWLLKGGAAPRRPAIDRDVNPHDVAPTRPR